MRSIALACAIKGGNEIALIGHTDCQVCKTTVSFLTDRFKALGVDRRQLPENLTEYFGLFASERANVIRGVEIIRHSPLIGPKVAVHGLLVDVQSGKLDWVVNGYDAFERPAGIRPILDLPAVGSILGASSAQNAFEMGEMKFPETKIGEAVKQMESVLSEAKPRSAPAVPANPPAPPPVSRPRAIPVPPPIRVRRP
jgi:carbonic anhydrase